MSFNTSGWKRDPVETARLGRSTTGALMNCKDEIFRLNIRPSIIRAKKSLRHGPLRHRKRLIDCFDTFMRLGTALDLGLTQEYNFNVSAVSQGLRQGGNASGENLHPEYRNSCGCDVTADVSVSEGSRERSFVRDYQWEWPELCGQSLMCTCVQEFILRQVCTHNYLPSDEKYLMAGLKWFKSYISG
ncbi:uncharacterized protein LOC135397925 [Ornithodoros turicata]|uniref:uncharacterized protein LOC135397925 n=1 Tax=Ornithodoros turicata TaxID=34597 RepID=UPI003139A80E